MKVVVFVLLLSAHCELTIALRRKHYFINEAKTWREAQQYCREKYADLSSLYDQQALEGLKNATNASTMTPVSTSAPYSYYKLGIWIGLNKISSVDWEWSDGSSRNPELYVHATNNTSLCTSLYMNMLLAFNCEIQQRFFCYKWEPELILVREKKSWEDALEYCRTHHTDLASLPSYLHLAQVKQTTAMAETPSVWTGLRFLSGSWFWVSGEDLGDIVQLPACPADHSYCGSRNLNTQRWENRDCMEELYFVCY